MSKELDEFYKSYSARITEIDDTPLVKVMDGGKFKLLSIEEYEEITNKLSDLEAKLAESEKENKVLKDIRTLERVVPRNAQLHKLSNRDCYIKGFENALSETVRTFEETYGKEKCKLVEERDKYLTDIVKAGGYEYQIEELKQQLTDKSQKIATLGDNYARLDEKYDFLQSAHEAVVEESLGYEKEIEHLKQQLAEKNADLHQIYSHLSVEAFCEDIHEQALKEIGRLQEQLAEKDDRICGLQFEVQQALSNNLGKTIKELVEKDNQDKIEFAIKNLKN